MTEEQIVALFPRCPWCREPETVTQKAWKLVMGEDNKTFVSFRKEVVPLTDKPPQFLAIPVLPALMLHYDSCSKCGRERVTKAEIKKVPVTMAPLGQQPSNFPRR